MRSIGQPALVISLVLFTALLVFDTFRVAQLEGKITRSKPPAHAPSAPVFSRAQSPRAADAPLATDFAEVSPLRSAEEIALEAALERWIGRIADLKTWIDRQPGVRNPDLQLTTNSDWYFAAMSTPLNTVDDFQRAARVLATAAATQRGTIIVEAMSLYVEKNGGPPTAVDQLVPYFSTPLDDEILRLLEISGGSLRYK